MDIQCINWNSEHRHDKLMNWATTTGLCNTCKNKGVTIQQAYKNTNDKNIKYSNVYHILNYSNVQLRTDHDNNTVLYSPKFHRSDRIGQLKTWLDNTGIPYSIYRYATYAIVTTLEPLTALYKRSLLCRVRGKD